MDITNNSAARQGVHAAGGVVYIAPGETKAVDLSEAGLKLAARLSFLEISQRDAPAPVAAEPQAVEKAATPRRTRRKG